MFPFLRTKLFLLLVVVAVGATFYYFGDQQKVLSTVLPKIKTTPLAPVVEKVETLNAEELTAEFQRGVKSTESELATLSQRTTDVSKHAGNVLGSSVQPVSEENSTPIHEKAFEYGKYIYCKQVVDDYEKLNPKLKE